MATTLRAPRDAERRSSKHAAQRAPLLDVKNFTAYFDLLLAATAQRKKLAFKIRGDVYCREFKYEPEEKCPGGLEQDDYDGNALHGLIVHRDRHLPAGCFRIVLPDQNDSRHDLPLEKACSASFTHPQLQPALLPRHDQLEISRLAVHTTFRRRTGEQATPDGMAEMAPFVDAERRAFPLISNILSLASISLAELIGREHIFVMMEPRLARLLKHLGLHFLQVSELIDYHGQRAAFYINTEQAVTSIKPEIRHYYDYTRLAMRRGLFQAGHSPQLPAAMTTSASRVSAGSRVVPLAPC